MLQLTLYVCDTTEKMQEQIRCLRAHLDAEYGGAYELRVHDLLLDSLAAKLDNIFSTPTLVREFPPPVVKAVGGPVRLRRVWRGQGRLSGKPADWL